jgi:hypothetical protein
MEVKSHGLRRRRGRRQQPAICFKASRNVSGVTDFNPKLGLKDMVAEKDLLAFYIDFGKDARYGGAFYIDFGKDARYGGAFYFNFDVGLSSYRNFEDLLYALVGYKPLKLKPKNQ